MKSVLPVVAAACAGWLCAAGVFAKPPARPAPPPATHSRSQHLSLEQAVQQVQKQTHGHILAADSVARGHNNVYRIKVLTPKGKVKVMQLHSNQKPQPRTRGRDSDQGGH